MPPKPLSRIELSRIGQYRLMVDTPFGDEMCWTEISFNEAFLGQYEAQKSEPNKSYRYYVEPEDH